MERIEWGSPLYEEGLRLRDAVLRQPLGMSIYDDDLASERPDIHILAKAGADAAGVLLLRRIGDTAVQMKQVAVAEAFRGRRVGARMVEYAERLAGSLGYAEMLLHARQTAAPFYEKLGYAPVGEPYTEIGLPHRTMTKRL